MTKLAAKRLWVQLGDCRKRQLGFLLVLMVITSFAEVLSIGAILPFLGVLVSPETLFGSPYAAPFISAFQITNPSQLLLPLTFAFVCAAMMAGILRLSLLWAQIRLGNAIGADLSAHLYEKTLHQPYTVHVSRNSSEMIAAISSKVNTVVSHVVSPLLAAASSFVLLLGVLAALITIDLVLSLIVILSFVILYSLVMVLSKKQLSRNGFQISQKQNLVVKALQEGLGGIRDVLLDGTQAVYCKIYRSADLPLRRAQANNQIIGAAPRFLIEAFGMILIASVAYALANRENGISAAVPLLGALALGAQRLLPVLQQLFSSWTSLRGGQASLSDVLDLLEQPIPKYIKSSITTPIVFNRGIKLNEVSFRYSNQAPWTLRDISLEVPKGARIGLIGSTGSGKSTLLDVLMALLQPTTGEMMVDGTVVSDKNLRSWQSQIAHVPQSIYLADTTIAENIAFGVPLEQIDYQRVRMAADLAQIAKTIESLERGYETLVGERGVRLSGGQKQRIGIARALYKPADFLILDEATSALDNETEASVVNAINSIGQDITILMVAHRLSTLRVCDTVYQLEAGQIKFSPFH